MANKPSAKEQKKVQVVFFVQKQKEFFLLLLQTNPMRGGFWQNITGSVEENESWEVAAKRELTEETGIEWEQLPAHSFQFYSLEKKWEFQDRWGRSVIEQGFCFLLKSENQAFPAITLDPHEHQNYSWHPVQKINQKAYFYEGNFEAFELSCKVLQLSAPL